MTFIYPLSGPNQCRKQMKKKPIATDMRQNRWLFTSFTKELNLGLPKLLSLTDLYENFVMWPTVQELLLDIVVFVSLVNSNQYSVQAAETANSVPCEEHWNNLKLVYVALYESMQVMVYHRCCKRLLLTIKTGSKKNC